MIKVTSLGVLLERMREDLVADLASRGFSLPEKAKHDVSHALMAAIRIEDRSIVSKPRRACVSSDLASRTLSAEHTTALATIRKEIESGQDLNPRLTRKFFRAGFNDRLLNDLLVQHLHLGDRQSGLQNIVEGTSDLLFAIVRDDEVLLLDLLDHRAFATFDFVDLIDRNWPELLRARELAGLLPAKQALSAAERARFRQAGMTPVIEREGRVYLSPGGPVADDGTSTRVLFSVMDLLHTISAYHDWVVSNSPALAEMVAAHQGHEVLELDIRVRQFANGELVFQYAQTDVFLRPALGVG